MSFERIKTRLMALPLHGKLVLIGGFLAAISVIMPWYEDLDAFRTGDVFLGISGPLYLAGVLILLASAFSITLVSTKAMGKKSIKLPMEESHTHIAVASLNLFLLLFVNSVYFHSKFGVNIAYKEIRFGMIFAFIGSLLLLAGAVMAQKSQEPDFSSTEGKIEPLIEMEPTQSKGSLESTDMMRQAHGVRKDLHKEQIPSHHEMARSIRSETGSGNTDHAEEKNDDPSQPWRMDL